MSFTKFRWAATSMAVAILGATGAAHADEFLDMAMKKVATATMFEWAILIVRTPRPIPSTTATAAVARNRWRIEN